MKCPEQDIETLLDQIRTDEAGAIVQLDRLIALYPGDAQLHFLQGSIHAGEGRIAEARQSMARALEIAPDYDVARFQLGLLELTSGEPAAAEQHWAPLKAYPADHFLRLFVEGLECLIRDDFPQTVALLRQGIEANDILPQMNHDMQLVIDQVNPSTEAEPEPALSDMHLLLQRYTTRH